MPICTSDPFIISEIYSWYLHPSEIDILDNNLLQKNLSPSIEPFLTENPFKKSHLYGEGCGYRIEWPWAHNSLLTLHTQLGRYLK